MKMGKTMGDMVFSVLDSDHNGYLDFKEFQQAIDLVGARLPDDRLRWSFRLYDMDNSGSIALGEMVMVSFDKLIMFNEGSFRKERVKFHTISGPPLTDPFLPSVKYFRYFNASITCSRAWVRDLVVILILEQLNYSRRLISMVTEN